LTAIAVVTLAACTSTSPDASIGTPPPDAPATPGAPSPALTPATSSTIDLYAETPAARSMARTLQERDLGSREPCAYIQALSIVSQTPTTPPAPDRFQCLVDAAGRGEQGVSVVALGPRGDGGFTLVTWILIGADTVAWRRYSIDPDGTVNEQTARSCSIDRTKTWGEPFSGC
jgi:hypothetical protein